MVISRLIPRDIRFLDLFVAEWREPGRGGAKLKELIDNFDRLDERVAEIQALEKDSDRIDHQIGQRLEEAFVAPFDREDIHELTVRLDDVVDLHPGRRREHGHLRRPRADDDCRLLAAHARRAGRRAGRRRWPSSRR